MLENKEFDSVKSTIVCKSYTSLNKFLNFSSQPISNLTNLLTLIHLNIRSIRTNFDEILVLLNCLSHNLDFIILSEIWINDFEVSMYNIDNYNCFAQCRSENKSGGIITYVNKKLDFMKISDVKLLSCEIVILYSKTFDLCLIALYRSHSYSIEFFNSELNLVLSHLNYKNIILVGDINIDISLNNINISSYLDQLAFYGFDSYVNIPTRVTRETSSCIDHIFFKSKCNFSLNTAIFHTDITDHFPIFSSINCSNNNIQTSKKCITTTNYNLLEKFMTNIKLEFNGDVNFNYNLFTSKIQSLVKQSTRVKFINSKNMSKKWINSEILQSIKNKEKLYIKHKKYPFDLTIKHLYKNAVKLVKSKIKAAKKFYYQREFQKCENNSHKQWKFINGIIGKNKKSFITPNNVNDSDAVNKFNDHFINCAVSDFTPIEFSSGFIKSYINSFFLNDTNIIELNSVVNSVSDNKSVGIDDITPRIYKLLIKIRPELIINIINQSFHSGIFPDQLKTAIVIPIFKAGDVNSLSNYRPISILPIFSKIIETIMKNKLIKFLESTNFFANNQFGFRKGFGTENALIEFTNNIYSNINKSLKTVAVFLDLSKAFDSVNHNILLHKLFNAGIRGKQLEWFRSYLNFRSQVVKIKNTFSNIGFIKKGVPQGSILGPILFTIFINDFCKLKMHGKIITYADDTVLLYSANDFDNLCDFVNADLKTVNKWLRNNDLKLNINKTKYMNFSLTQNNNVDLNLKFHDHNCVNFNCNCPKLEKVDSIKYLGIYVDQNLKWNNHVNFIVNKLRRNLYIFYYLKNHVDFDFFFNLYYSWVQSVLQYGVICWGGDYNCNILPVINIQNKFFRLLNFKDTDKTILPVKKLFLYRMLQYIFKNKNDFKERNTIYEFRKNHNLEIPQTKKQILQNSFLFLGPHEFNKLPNEVKCEKSFYLFKKFLRTYISNLSNVNNHLKTIK